MLPTGRNTRKIAWGTMCVAVFALPAGTAAPQQPEAWTSALGSILEAARRARVDLIVLVLLLTLASTAVSRRLASRRAHRS